MTRSRAAILATDSGQDVPRSPCSPGGGIPVNGLWAATAAANLIRLAYLVFPTGQPNAPVSAAVFQMPISGGPAWIDSDRYTIDAKSADPVNVEETTPLPEAVSWMGFE